MNSRDQCIGYALIPVVVEELEHPAVYIMNGYSSNMPHSIEAINSHRGINIWSLSYRDSIIC